MKRTKIKAVLDMANPPGEVFVQGWVRTKRDAKDFSFIELNDGSCLANIQVIAGNDLAEYSEVEKLTTGSAASVTGQLVASPGKGQKWEIQATALDVISIAPENYPLQKKRHTDEFLRSIAHLRQAGPNDVTIFYYSGHGSQMPDVSGDEIDAVLTDMRLPDIDGLDLVARDQAHAGRQEKYHRVGCILRFAVYLLHGCDGQANGVGAVAGDLFT